MRFMLCPLLGLKGFENGEKQSGIFAAAFLWNCGKERV